MAAACAAPVRWKPQPWVDPSRPEVLAALLGAGALLSTKSIGHLPADVLRGLIAGGMDVRRVDDAGSTPLHYVREGAGVRVLVAAGVDPCAKDRRGDTPLHTAAQAEVALELIAAGKPTVFLCRSKP